MTVVVSTYVSIRSICKLVRQHIFFCPPANEFRRIVTASQNSCTSTTTQQGYKPITNAMWYYHRDCIPRFARRDNYIRRKIGPSTHADWSAARRPLVGSFDLAQRSAFDCNNNSIHTSKPPKTSQPFKLTTQTCHQRGKPPHVELSCAMCSSGLVISAPQPQPPSQPPQLQPEPRPEPSQPRSKWCDLMWSSGDCRVWPPLAFACIRRCTRSYDPLTSCSRTSF